MSHPAISLAVADLPKPKPRDWVPAPRTSAIATAAASMTAHPAQRLRRDLNIAHFAGDVDGPRLDCVVVIDRSCATHRAQLWVGRLDIAGFVDHAGLQQGRAALPIPVQTKARECPGQHWLLEARGVPVSTAVGRD